MPSQAQLLIEALREAGYKPRRYSGRGMEGKWCVGIACKSIWPVGSSLAGKIFFELPMPTTDQLGKGIIAYWPSIAWPGGKDDE